MAKTTITQITDDLDGSRDADTYSFAWEGTSYTIDLSKKNAKAFEKALEPYLGSATSYNAGDWEPARGISLPRGGDKALKRVWVIAASDDGTRLWAGGDPGVLFESRDGGASWELNQALWQHPTRPRWRDMPQSNGITIEVQTDFASDAPMLMRR